MAKGCAMGRTEKLCLVGVIFGLVSGGASVVLDLDHLAALWWKGLPITWENLARHAGRPLHVPALVVSGAFCLIFGALYFGWLALDA